MRRFNIVFLSGALVISILLSGLLTWLKINHNPQGTIYVFDAAGEIVGLDYIHLGLFFFLKLLFFMVILGSFIFLTNGIYVFIKQIIEATKGER